MYEVQHRMADGTWENVWKDEDGNRQTFGTRDDAEAELAVFFVDVGEPYMDCDLGEYRVVPVEEGSRV